MRLTRCEHGTPLDMWCPTCRMEAAQAAPDIHDAGDHCIGLFCGNPEHCGHDAPDTRLREAARAVVKAPVNNHLPQDLWVAIADLSRALEEVDRG